MQEQVLKDFIFYLCWSVCLVKQNHFCKFGRGPNEEHLCENILNLG